MQVKDCKESLGSNLYHTLRTKENLPLKYIMFVGLYVTNNFNATEAYLGSVARKGTNRASAGVEGHRILNMPKVQAAIQVVVDSWLNEKRIKLEQEIIEVLYRRAFYDPFMFVNPDGTVKITKPEQIPEEWRCVVDGVEKKFYGKDADTSSVVLKLANKEVALRELSKYIELYKEAAIVTHKITGDTADKLNQLFQGGDKKKVEAPVPKPGPAVPEIKKPEIDDGNIPEKVEIN